MRELEIKGQKSRNASGLYVSNNNKTKNNLRSQKKNNQSGNHKDKPEEKKEQGNKGKAHNYKCHHCGKPGHFKKECRQWLAKKAASGEMNVATDVGAHSPEVMVAISDCMTTSAANYDQEWIMDSGCSFHMSPRKEYFEDLVREDLEVVSMGNYSKCQARGKGKVTFVMKDGRDVILTEVRWVPGLRRNLISTSILDDMGCRGEHEGGVYKILRNGKVVLEGSK